MTDSEAYVAFNLAENVGFAKVEALAASAGSVAAAWERFPAKVARDGGEVDWRREFALAARFGVTLITPADPDYPPQLKSVTGRPLALYVKGDVKALSKPAIAMVGTRRATPHGRSMANRLAHDLAQAGWAVISGLALGIDAESHRGALDAGGVTVGVLGSGLDRFYPEENRALARDMVEKGGAVVSEFPFGRPPDKETFPIRNHVVAALARGVLAVEAPLKSGTLITTSIAADLGRTVMAVPGRPDDRMSAGCLSLVREGAVLVRNVDDILEEMAELLPKVARHPSPDTARDPESPTYSAEEALVMLNLDENGVTIDELARLTGLSAEKVNSLAIMLRIKGFVRFLPGNRISPLTTGRKL